MNEGSTQGSCIHTCWHVDWHAWVFLSMFIIPMKGFYIYYSRHGCRINNDQFPNRVPQAKASRGVWRHTPTGDFLDFTVNSLKSSFLGFRVGILAIFQLGNFLTTESIFTVETGVDLRPYNVENIQNIWMKWYCTVMSSQTYLQDGINVFTIQLLVKLMHFPLPFHLWHHQNVMLIDNYDTLCAAGKRSFKPYPNEGMGKMQREKTNIQTNKNEQTIKKTCKFDQKILVNTLFHYPPFK